MTYFKSLPPNAGPPVVYQKYPEVYLPWSEMSQAAMNGDSPLTQGERELLFAYASGVMGSQLPAIAHSEVAYAWGVERGLVEKLLKDPDAPGVEPRLKALLSFVRKLAAAPTAATQEDVDQMVAAGWDEKAVHDAILVTARAAFMAVFISGHGFKPLSREVAAQRAHERIEHGYVNLFPAFRKKA